MGQVWRALDTTLHRQVALKFLPTGDEADPQRLARLQREARLLAALSHPHIATVHGLHDEGGMRFLAMELVPGEDLASRLKAGPLPTESALEIAIAVADALAAAHAQGIVHRDLKPANVVTAPGGQVKVLDFGLGRLVGAPETADRSGAVTATALTGPTTVLGTPAYMSPEQIRGRTVDRGTDVWAFGCLLYELLSGRPAFGGETRSDSMAAALEREPDWSRLPPDLPDQVRWILRRCLRKDPEARLRDMADIGMLLQEAHTRPAASVDSDAQRQGELAGSGRPWLAMAGAALATCALCAVAALWLWPSTPEPPLRRFELSRGPFNAQRGTAVALSPDGSRLAYVLQGETWLRDLSRTEPRRLDEPEEAVGVFWSPEGRRLGILAAGTLMRLDSEGGRPVTICRLDPEVQGMANTAAGAAWLASGTIAFTTGQGEMWGVPAAGGVPEVLFPRRAERDLDYHDVRALPDGEGLIFIVHGPTGIDTISVWRDGRIEDLLTLEGERLMAPVLAPQGLVVFGRQAPFSGIWAAHVDGDLHVRDRPFRVLEFGSYASVSRQGLLVTMERPPYIPGQLIWLDRSGGRIGSVPSSGTQMSLLDLAPDGDRVALVERDARDWDLWVAQVDGDRRNRLTLDEGQEIAPSWSPDGRRLVYSRGSTPENLVILEQVADGSGEERRLARGVIPAYGPQGESVYYSGWDPQKRERIERVSAAGGEPEVVLSGPGRLLAPRPSPDGRLLAYASDETGRFEIYVTRLPEATGRWQVSTEGGHWPRWRADGRELYFARGDSILAASVHSGDEFRIGPVQTLLTRPPASEPLPFGWPPGFDVSADGQRFLIQAAADASQARTTLVLTQGWDGSPLD